MQVRRGFLGGPLSVLEALVFILQDLDHELKWHQPRICNAYLRLCGFLVWDA